MFPAIAVVALLASFLTFFSGFGLGTILLPFFALFFNLPTSILLTAIVHFLNNVFKFFLVGKKISKTVFFTFGLPSFFAAFGGALLLEKMAGMQPLFSYHLYNAEFNVSLMNLIIGILMMIFALWEIIPFLKNIGFNRNKLILGGVVSGFFGGLSGHQGAMRSAFLIRLDLEKEVFIATGVGIACLVDIARMIVYTGNISMQLMENNYELLTAVLSAWIGAFIGNKLLKKTTYSFIKWFVLVFIMLIAILVAAGILNR